MQTNNKMVEAAAGVHEKYQLYFRSIFDEGPLSDRERMVAALAAALALNNEALIRTFVMEAKEANLGNNEVGHVSALVDLVRLESQHASAETATVKKARSCC